MTRNWYPTRWHRLAAVFLMLWWGGLNCLTGCVMAMPDAGHCAAESSLAAAVETPDEIADCCAADRQCTKSTAPTDSLHPLPPPPSAPQLDCCALENHQTTTEHGRRVGAKADANKAAPSFAQTTDATTRNLATAGTVRLPDRGGTHLRLCLFRI